MPTRLFMVRHGATVLSAEDRFAGSTDNDVSHYEDRPHQPSAPLSKWWDASSR